MHPMMHHEIHECIFAWFVRTVLHGLCVHVRMVCACTFCTLCAHVFAISIFLWFVILRNALGCAQNQRRSGSEGVLCTVRALCVYCACTVRTRADRESNVEVR